jgi:hypothetical protein
MKGSLAVLVLAGALLLPPAALADIWEPVSGTPPTSLGGGTTAYVQPDEFRAYTLADNPVATAPAARSLRATTVLTLPAPDGSMQRFEVTESPIMEPELAARHPEITTWSGRGIDDPAATIRADQTPLGFHASVRSPYGAWYVDPYYHLDDSLYITYYGRDLSHDANAGFVEQEVDEDVNPLALDVPQGPEVLRRTYRLALVTDPGYSTFWGGEANVTAAKVTLMNRVNQIYEDETAIRLVLIADTDKLNLNTQALLMGANGPCGAAPCYAATPSCNGATIQRTRIVIGQIIGASNYDIGHIALGTPGGGVASLGVVGGNGKAQGCTGLARPIGDFFAVDYVSHEMGHQFAGNHTFNGTIANCSGGNRNATTSVEPGSGTSIMAYAGICGQDNLQPHSDPYWSQRSFDEITTYVTSSRPPINEVQTVSLTGFDTDGDSLRLRLDGADSRPIVRGSNSTVQGIADAVNGNEVQSVAPGAGPYTLSYLGADSGTITPGQNDTQLGILNAIQGGNEQQVVTLTNFSGATQSFQVQIGGATSAVLGAGGAAINNANVAAAINAIPGFAGTVTSAGAGNTGFTLTFAGASAGVDVPPVEIVNCTGTCVATVRQTANGGPPLATWPAGATVVVGPVTAAGFSLSFGGGLQATDVGPFTVSNGTVTETFKGAPAMLPAGATVTVAGFAGGALNDTGFQLTFGGSLANMNVNAVTVVEATGATGFVGETAKGGPIDNQGHLVEATGNHAPTVTVPGPYTIPNRTPFALTGSATDFDGDTVTYMWEQNDRGGISGGSQVGTALTSNSKTNGPLFRQFGKAVDISPTDTELSPSPGLNATDTNPTRVFPDIEQILANNTNAATGACPPGPPVQGGSSGIMPIEFRECYSEFLPTDVYVGFNNDRTMTFRLTARDGNPGAGGIGSAQTRVAVAQSAGPFLVTSHATAATLRAGSTQTVTWNVAGTDVSPVGTTDVKISLLSGEVLVASTPNDGSADVTVPNVADQHARIKVEAVGNVYFDLSDTDLVIQAAPEVEVTDQSVQYSDAVSGTVVKASDADTAGSALTATATGLPAGLSLADGATSEHTRTWTLAGNVTAAPGTYTGSVTVTDGDGEAITKPLIVTVKPEDATVTYLGDTMSSGKVQLRARLTDADDGAPGDISKATIAFREGSTTLCTALSCVVTLPNGTHAISVEAGGYYAGAAQVTVRVAKATRKVSAIGFISHLSTLFAIDNKYAEIVYGKDGRAYRISADDLESSGFTSDGRRAELRFTAELWDHTKILRPVRVGRNLTLQISLSESGKGSIAFSLWDGNTLVHDQPERTLAGGFVTIR